MLLQQPILARLCSLSAPNPCWSPVLDSYTELGCAGCGTIQRARSWHAGVQKRAQVLRMTALLSPPSLQLVKRQGMRQVQPSFLAALR